MKVEGHAFLVTGGASGLGEGTARMLVAKGGMVSILDRDVEKGEAIQKELGAKCQFVEVDICEEDSIRAAVEKVHGKWGRIDGCINCAGVGSALPTVNKKGAVHDMDTFNFVVKLNLIGTFSVASKCAGIMAKQPEMDDGERGVIINVASVAAFDGQNGQAAYSASKGGVVGMTLPMARDLGRFGIRVNTIAPGLVDTPLNRVETPIDERNVDEMDRVGKSLITAQSFPTKRFGRPSELAHLVKFMFESPFCNGETVRLDGGIRMPKL